MKRLRARLAYHEVMGLLSVGDLHPGGAAATDILLRELAKEEPGRALEVGAGIGLTTRRLLRQGWQVTPVEPNEILRALLEKRLRVRAHPGPLERLDDAEPYDALIAESVLYGMDLPSAFARAHRLLRPGGLLAMIDMVWTDAARPDTVADLHRETKARFGIAMASREPVTWPAWKRMLGSAGFVEVTEQRLAEGATPRDWRRAWTMLANGLRHPLALAQYAAYRRASRAAWAPAGWLESWAAVWRRS